MKQPNNVVQLVGHHKFTGYPFSSYLIVLNRLKDADDDVMPNTKMKTEE